MCTNISIQEIANHFICRLITLSNVLQFTTGEACLQYRARVLSWSITRLLNQNRSLSCSCSASVSNQVHPNIKQPSSRIGFETTRYASHTSNRHGIHGLALFWILIIPNVNLNASAYCKISQLYYTFTNPN